MAENVVHINLTQGKVALIDAIDFKSLPNRKWYSVKDTRTFYVHAKIQGKSTPLHRLIMNPEKGMVVDHINGNGLDNRRKNLRVVSQNINAANRTAINKNNSSGIPNVSWRSSNKKWRVQISRGGILKHFGYFKKLKEAEEAYMSIIDGKEYSAIIQ